MMFVNSRDNFLALSETMQFTEQFLIKRGTCVAKRGQHLRFYINFKIIGVLF